MMAHHCAGVPQGAVSVSELRLICTSWVRINFSVHANMQGTAVIAQEPRLTFGGNLRPKHKVTC